MSCCLLSQCFQVSPRAYMSLSSWCAVAFCHSVSEILVGFCSGDVGLGLNVRRMRNEFLSLFTITYSLRPLGESASVFRRYPGQWQVRYAASLVTEMPASSWNRCSTLGGHSSFCDHHLCSSDACADCAGLSRRRILPWPVQHDCRALREAHRYVRLFCMCSCMGAL